ncbi:hypothetical protein [Pseudanabaena sp. BC1403]|uniref:hypothetical protein n=1 Tax=Pseudanabaena sp. BC1403 TaxID=2043171 RepID=UPI000CD8D24C|nr:hypothetical protein [Pseudanabaena sp. BC1403]
MKCINCGTDSNLRDRTNNQGKCQKCGTRFAFEPTSMPSDCRFTDPSFQKILNNISANDTLFFTKGQLFHALPRRKNSSVRDWLRAYFTSVGFSAFLVVIITPALVSDSRLTLSFNEAFIKSALIISTVNSIWWFVRLWLISQDLKYFRRERLTRARSLQALGVILLNAATVSLFLQQLLGVGIFFILGASAVGLGVWQARRIPNTMEATPPITPQMFDSLLEKWISAHGAPPKLLLDTNENNFSVPNLPGVDVTNYSFDRLIICQSDNIAQMLLSNNFHFEYNSGIVSINHYPSSIFETIMIMARRNPDLKVFVLHDCSPDGIRTLNMVKYNSQWFGGQTTAIMDVGISPRQILSAKRSVVTQSSEQSIRVSLGLESEIRDNLTTEELKWFDAGNYVLLEFFSPQRILQTLSRCLYLGEQSGAIEGNDSDLIILGGDSFYGVENFG